MAIGEYSAYSSLQADSKANFLAWQPPGADGLTVRRPEWTLAIAP